jgi:hypothetical protein
MNIKKWILLLASALLLVLNFISVELNFFPTYDGKEKLAVHLQPLQTVAALESYADTMAKKSGIATHSFAYLALLENTIANRFYHGFSHYKLSENWIAALAGKLLKEDYSCKVNTAHIMQQSNAACSQQALVMMEILRHKKIDYRSIGFPHHYALEAMADGQWYFFDANMEPRMSAQERSLEHWQHQADRLKPFYSTSRFTDLDYKLGVNRAANPGTINEEPAQHARVFHAVTGMLSKTLWLLPLFMFCRMYRFVFIKPRFNPNVSFGPTLSPA